jgi:RNA polymerase sigma-70 factor (ECF subfamily)
LIAVPNQDLIRNPEAYVRTIASNLAREHAIRSGPVTVDIDDPTIQGDMLSDDASVEEAVEHDQRVQRLREVVRGLPPTWHAVLRLRYQEGLRYREIARSLGVSINTVKQYLRRGLARCALRMERLR